MGARPLLHELTFHREEAVDLRRVKSSHGNLVAARDDRNQIWIRVGDDIVEEVVLLLSSAAVRIVQLRLLGNVHAADIIERVCQQARRVIVGSADLPLTRTVGHVFPGDLRVSSLQAMAAE